MDCHPIQGGVVVLHSMETRISSLVEWVTWLQYRLFVSSLKPIALWLEICCFDCGLPLTVICVSVSFSQQILSFSITFSRGCSVQCLYGCQKNKRLSDEVHDFLADVAIN